MRKLVLKIVNYFVCYINLNHKYMFKKRKSLNNCFEKNITTLALLYSVSRIFSITLSQLSPLKKSVAWLIIFFGNLLYRHIINHAKKKKLPEVGRSFVNCAHNAKYFLAFSICFLAILIIVRSAFDVAIPSHSCPS